MKIAILTGGGDVPGLNTTIKGLTTGALAHGWQVLGIKRGWAGLLYAQPDDADSVAQHTCVLDAENTRGIDRLGGTMLHSSRTNPSKVARDALPEGFVADPRAATDAPQDCLARVIQNLSALQVDVLIAIGGDDTLGVAARLAAAGVQVLGIPKTMDNDVHGTEYCLGFATCVARSVAYLQQLRSCTASHERIAVVEVMGRNSGATSLMPAYLASVDRALIAEVPIEMDRLLPLLLQDRRSNPQQYAMLTVSEGAHFSGGAIQQAGAADAFGHQKLGGIGEQVGAAIKARTGVGVVQQSLGYLVRSGPPDPLDIMVTYNFASLAIALIVQRKFGRLIRIADGRYGHAPLAIVSEGIKTLDVARFYDSETYRPRVADVMGLGLYLY